MGEQILDLVDGISRTPPKEEFKTNLENNSMQTQILDTVPQEMTFLKIENYLSRVIW